MRGELCYISRRIFRQSRTMLPITVALEGIRTSLTGSCFLLGGTRDGTARNGLRVWGSGNCAGENLTEGVFRRTDPTCMFSRIRICKYVCFRSYLERLSFLFGKGTILRISRKLSAYFIIDNNTDTLPPICTFAPEAAHPLMHYRTKPGVFTARH